MPFIAIALVIAAALGGGTAAVAQTSLPGDALWGFKVHVNEGVAGALAASDSARADWNLNTIKTRMFEAQKLSAKGELTAEAQADIAANIKVHADGITDTVTKLVSNGDTYSAATIAARYQAELAAAADNTSAAASAKGSNDALNAGLHAALEDASTLSASVSVAVR